MKNVLPGPMMEMLLKQIRPMFEQAQRQAEQIEKELDEARVEGTAGGGAVKVIASGLGEILEVKLDPQVVNPNELEMLQDLIVAAVRDAIKQAEDLQAERFGPLGPLQDILKMRGLFPQP